jgi:Tfp pilus assembly protein PilN
VRPVNLLPAKHRGRAGAGGRKGGAYVVVGVMGALLFALAMYVLAANQVTGRQSDLARVQQETQVAQQKAAANADYGDFAQIKATRLSAVTALAQERFDWERMAREIAHVLPSGVALTGLEASLAGDATPGQSPAAAGTPGAEPPTPSLKVSGCATGHPAVADTLVRLRRLHRVDEVNLTESANAGSGATPGASGAASASAGTLGCDGKQNYSFSVVVKFELADVVTAPRKVPARLGGGS